MVVGLCVVFAVIYRVAHLVFVTGDDQFGIDAADGASEFVTQALGNSTSTWWLLPIWASQSKSPPGPSKPD